ncbi:hypothetical protein N8843_10285 [Verrucomicrobia bacterium]|nr:hypothetical protein [Verrucomicrobiota bacterium]
MAPLGHLQTLFKLPALVRDSSPLGCSLLYPLHDDGFFAGNRDAVGASTADGVFRGTGCREFPKAVFKELALDPSGCRSRGVSAHATRPAMPP